MGYDNLSFSPKVAFRYAFWVLSLGRGVFIFSPTISFCGTKKSPTDINFPVRWDVGKSTVLGRFCLYESYHRQHRMFTEGADITWNVISGVSFYFESGSRNACMRAAELGGGGYRFGIGGYLSLMELAGNNGQRATGAGGRYETG